MQLRFCRQCGAAIVAMFAESLQWCLREDSARQRAVVLLALVRAVWLRAGRDASPIAAPLARHKLFLPVERSSFKFSLASLRSDVTYDAADCRTAGLRQGLRQGLSLRHGSRSAARRPRRERAGRPGARLATRCNEGKVGSADKALVSNSDGYFTLGGAVLIM